MSVQSVISKILQLSLKSNLLLLVKSPHLLKTYQKQAEILAQAVQKYII